MNSRIVLVAQGHHDGCKQLGLFEKMIEARRAVAIVQAQQGLDPVHSEVRLATEVIAEIVQEAGELGLKVAGQDGMRYGPRDDREVFGPSALRDEPRISRGKVLEPGPDGLAVPEPVPSVHLALEALPIFLAV